MGHPFLSSDEWRSRTNGALCLGCGSAKNFRGKISGRYFMRKQLKTNRKEFGNRLEYGVSIVELWTIGQVRLSISYMAWPSGGGGLWVIVRCAQFPAACFGMGDSLERVFL